ncbi:MAG: AI-2E family transporter [Actinomycetota bacterium]
MAKEPKNLQTFKTIGIICWSAIGIIIVAGLFFYLLYQIKVAIIPLVIAVVIAYLMSPLVLLLEKRIRKIFAVIITYVIFLGIISVTFFFIIPVIVDQFDLFIRRFPFYIQNLANLINEFIRTSLIVQNIENITGVEIETIDTMTITQYIIYQLNIRDIDVLSRITEFTGNIVNVVLNFIVAPILGFFILKDMERIRALTVKVFPYKARFHLDLIIDKMNNVAGRYIRVRLFISIIVGIASTIALLILKIDFAVFLGFIVGFFNLIPFIGPIIGAVPAVLMAVLVSPIKSLVVVIIFIIIQIIDAYFLFPIIMKYQVGIHPAVAIFSLIAGGALFGIWGMLLAVPLVAIIQELARFYFIERKQTKT